MNKTKSLKSQLVIAFLLSCILSIGLTTGMPNANTVSAEDNIVIEQAN